MTRFIVPVCRQDSYKYTSFFDKTFTGILFFNEACRQWLFLFCNVCGCRTGWFSFLFD
ncbi:hypothetical protein HMPREF9446_01895 [Bacteroides fluxus YIT 12057]|uniref:Uncharacterized protein n=1 Tax=Bacteroides fluxus YIT 12057 TaxID=763034 RepID=F3PT29_9BACE|nr:hypothetical protein HMPREF9446_01895 [Bacteroides fluxus YIT 12057]